MASGSIQAGGAGTFGQCGGSSGVDDNICNVAVATHGDAGCLQPELDIGLRAKSQGMVNESDLVQFVRRGLGYRRSAVEHAAAGAQHNQIIRCSEHFHARLMHHRYHRNAASCKFFEQLEQRQRAAAVQAAGGLVEEQAQRRPRQRDAEADAAPLAAADAAVLVKC